MASEKVKEFLEKLRNDPKAQELLKNNPLPEKNEDRIKVFAQLAIQLDYDLSEADFEEAYREAEQMHKDITDKAAQKINELPDDELENAAGGHGHTEPCADTYMDAENCWITDGCDKSNIIYNEYICQHNDRGKQCGAAESVECSGIFFRKPSYL